MNIKAAILNINVEDGLCLQVENFAPFHTLRS